MKRLLTALINTLLLILLPLIGLFFGPFRSPMENFVFGFVSTSLILVALNYLSALLLKKSPNKPQVYLFSILILPMIMFLGFLLFFYTGGKNPIYPAIFGVLIGTIFFDFIQFSEHYKPKKRPNK